jgi:hypothetical protein
MSRNKFQKPHFRFSIYRNNVLNFLSQWLIIKGKGQNVKNQNVESPKVDQKFDKDQNVESKIRLSTF